MLDYDAQAQLASATADLLRSCAIATAQTMSVSACHGLTLWSDLLRAPVRPGPLSSRVATRALPNPFQAANPFQTMWQFSPAAWVPRSTCWAPDGLAAGAWTPGGWMNSGPMAAFGWSPFASTWGGWPTAAAPSLGDWTANWTRMVWPAWNFQTATTAPLMAQTTAIEEAVRQAVPANYSSYRSSGGHAVAQIVAPAASTAVAGMAVAVAVTQMQQSMLDAWRSALGA